MRLEKCFFCGSTVFPGHGLQFVRNDAKVFRFCRSKCHKHFKMKHNPRKTKWTKAFRKVRGKDLVMDSSLEFEKKRNNPPKYDRELYAATLKAMDKIQEVKEKRQKQFWEKRMKSKTKLETVAGRRELERNIDIIKGPRAFEETLPEVEIHPRLKSKSKAVVDQMEEDE